MNASEKEFARGFANELIGDMAGKFSREENRLVPTVDFKFPSSKPVTRALQ